MASARLNLGSTRSFRDRPEEGAPNDCGRGSIYDSPLVQKKERAEQTDQHADRQRSKVEPLALDAFPSDLGVPDLALRTCDNIVLWCHLWPQLRLDEVEGHASLTHESFIAVSTDGAWC